MSMAEHHGKFACALNCMDGRSIKAVMLWMEKNYGVDWTDQPDAAGTDKILATGEPAGDIEKLKERAEISVYKHGSPVVAVVGHDLCAGNPVSKEEHLEHIRKGAERVRSWNLGVPVIGLWVYPQNPAAPPENQNWTVEVIEK